MARSGSVSGLVVVSLFDDFVDEHYHVLKLGAFCSGFKCEVFESSQKLLIFGLFPDFVVEEKLLFEVGKS